MIRIGNQTAWSAPRPTDAFKFALAQNFDAFEWFPDKKLDSGWDESDLGTNLTRYIYETAQARGMRLSVHARWQANPFRPEGLAMLMEDLEFARSLGAVLLNVHLHLQSGPDAFISAINPLLNRIAESNLELSFENTPDHSPEVVNDFFKRIIELGAMTPPHSPHKGELPKSAVPPGLIATPDRSRALKRRAILECPFGTESKVGMCLDLGHANLCAATRNDYLGYVDRLGSHVRINHVHLHENWGDRDSHLTLFTGPSGQDDSGIRRFMDVLVSRGFSGSIILEQWPHPPDLLIQARARILAMLSEHKGPAIAPSRVSIASNDASDAFGAAIVEANKRARSWREKLDGLRELLARQDAALTEEQLVDAAIYLRFLGSGQIACAEDGRHFRPGHHARIGQEIQQSLASHPPEQSIVVRKILPWLPSSAEQFQRAEPLTRIRDIAHRNDIPSELKHEIKHTLQNKLHRCAGPEDLVTSSRILARITGPGARYSPSFVDEFRLFHHELEEFFNAQSLDQRLEALASRIGVDDAGLVRAFRELKLADRPKEQLEAIATLTQLRVRILELANGTPPPQNQDLLLADIALEDFAFVVSSKVVNVLETPSVQFQWEMALELCGHLVCNLELSRIQPEECRSIGAELAEWRRRFESKDREQLLRIKATLERSRQLAESLSMRIVSLFSLRAEILGRELGVVNEAVEVFCESEVRSHLAFQLARLISVTLKHVRIALGVPAYDTVVAGTASGKLTLYEQLGDSATDLVEAQIALVEHAQGDEQIPEGIGAVIFGQAIPFLSHLAVRGRQRGIVLVASEDPEQFSQFRKLQGSHLSLLAGPDKVEWKTYPTANPAKPAQRRVKIDRFEARLDSPKFCLPLNEVTVEIAGPKADSLRRLQELSSRSGSGFSVPPAVVIPFGVMEMAIRSGPDRGKWFAEFLSRVGGCSRETLAAELTSVHERFLQIKIPAEVEKFVLSSFREEQRLMVRSSANLEDLHNFSGAGLYETISNVHPRNIATALRAVWCSLFSQRAIIARREAGLGTDVAHMAVIIQQMIVPDFSFVLHTVNPITKDSGEVYAEVAVGLGETLVSADAPGTPYRLVCNKVNGSVTTLAFANFSAGRWPGAQDQIVHRTIDYSDVELSRNSRARLALGGRLATMGRLIEHAFGSPQDVEGGVLDNRIYLFQSRPQQGLNE